MDPKIMTHKGHEVARRHDSRDFLRVPSCPSWSNLKNPTETQSTRNRLPNSHSCNISSRSAYPLFTHKLLGLLLKLPLHRSWCIF